MVLCPTLELVKKNFLSLICGLCGLLSDTPYMKLAKHSYLPILWYYGTVSHIGVSVEKISFPHLWAVWAALRHPLQEASQALLLTNQHVVLWFSVPHWSFCRKISSPAIVGSVVCSLRPQRPQQNASLAVLQEI